MNTKRTKHTNQQPQTLETQRFQRRARRIYAMITGAALTAVFMAVPALAAETGGDALTAVNNLSTFIFALIRAVGIILLGYGILQVGLSFQSHDPSQRSNRRRQHCGGNHCVELCGRTDLQYAGSGGLY